MHPSRKILHIPRHKMPVRHLGRRQNNRIRQLDLLLPSIQETATARVPDDEPDDKDDE